MGGEMNGHIVGSQDGYEDVMCLFGFLYQNPEGSTVLDVCRNQQLQILNTYFEKKTEKHIT